MKPEVQWDSPDLLERIPAFARRWRAGQLQSAVFAALYFLHWQIARNGRAFAARRCKDDARPDAQRWLGEIAASTGADLRERLVNCFMRYQFRDVRASVAVALQRWLHDEWTLQLRENVPRPAEVLHAQALGFRPVTVICAFPRMFEPVLTKPDAFAFFLHDLEHAYKFFHSAPLHAAQQRFFARLQAAVRDGLLERYRADGAFAAKLDYLMSDMNTHPQHSRQYLRAILIDYHLRAAGKPLDAALDAPDRRRIDDVLTAMDAGAGLADAGAAGCEVPMQSAVGGA